MNVLRAEWVKLSTLPQWWYLGSLGVLGLGVPILLLFVRDAGVRADLDTVHTGVLFTQVVVVVFAVQATASEFRYATLRATFLAVPRRWTVVAGKATVVAVTVLVATEVLAAASWAAAWLLDPNDALLVRNLTDLRVLAGMSVSLAWIAVISVAVAAILRSAAAAIAVVLLWPLLVDTSLTFVPVVGASLTQWSPFTAAFAIAGTDPGLPYGPLIAFLYVAGFSVLLLGVGAVVIERRDA